jgi:predicted deacetylase
MKKPALIFLFSIAFLIIVIFLVRLISPSEIDDVSPGISCPEIEKYSPDVLYVIPDYNNTQISENKLWCDEILKLNKTLALHGITHVYREFLYENISQEELNFALNEFQKCFNRTPEKFKAPHLEINEQNKKLILENNLEYRNWIQQITRKVYHCNNDGITSNKIIKLF